MAVVSVARGRRTRGCSRPGSRLSSRLRDRARRGFTFIELLVILSILGVGVYFASVGTSGQNAYYGLRGDVEKIVATIQRACIQSAARPNIQVAGRNVTAGVTFYNRCMGPGFVIQNGLSFVGWFDDLPNNPVAQQEPPATLDLATPKIQELSKALRADTKLFTRYPNAPMPNNARLRYRNGRLDVFQVNGSVGGGDLAQLNASFSPVNTPSGPSAWEFDVANDVAGWVRIRCLSGGFVEVSGMNAPAVVTPVNVVGGVF